MKNCTYILLFSLLLWSGCLSETDEVLVDEELTYYFQIFEDEALARKVEVDLDQIEAHIDVIAGDRVVGQCMRNENAFNQITVDRTYWRNLTPLDKEFLVFHELGHCVLDREHDETQDRNGVCKSIMGSGLRCKPDYSNMTRKDYLDELFAE